LNLSRLNEGANMPARKTTLIFTLAVMVAGGVNACYQAKSPDQVAQDTAAAESKADAVTGKAEQRAADKIDSAQAVVSDEKAAAAHTRAIEIEKIADTRAEGNHKVALAQCESLAGEPQKACREQADTAFTTAEDEARQVRAETDPKP
jgi:long-subunit acyl-CoA synthetase (AMP-forming)